MTQWLRTPTVLVEDLSSISSTHISWLTTVTPVPGDPVSFSGFHGYCTHVVYIQANRSTHKCIKKNKKK